MKHRLSLVALLVCLSACSTKPPTTPDPGPPPAPRTYRIMPFGDSITEGDGGHVSYRYWLYKRLTADGRLINMVGSRNGVFRGTPLYTDFDMDHEGHWGWTTGELAARAAEWAAANPPDFALLHVGTNDALRGLNLDESAANVATIVGALRQANPAVKIALAQVIDTASRPANIRTWNARIPALAASLSTAASPVVVVDQFTGFDPLTETYDGIHPNEAGEKKLADKFHSALTSLGFSQQP